MKTRFTLSLSLSLMMIFSSVVSQSYAQATTAAGYYFSAKSGTYSYLSGGTSVSAVQVDDGLSSSISLGFTFRYCGVDYTNIYASSNGWITFGSSPYIYAYPGSTGYLATGSSSGIGPAVMALWDDVSGTSGACTYTSTGTAPNRIFTIEFKDWLWDYSTSTPAISFQIKLFETTNVIQIMYKQEAGTPFWDYTSGATIGIGGGTSTDFLALDNSASPSVSSSTLYTSITTKPPSGQIYEFAPLPNCSGTPSSLAPLGPTAKVCPGATFTLTENPGFLSLAKTYQWRSSPAGSGTYSDIVGETNSTLNTSITANTDFILVTTCTVSGLSSTSTAKTVNVVGNPAITASGPVSFCSNQLLRLSTPTDAAYTYQWINVASGSIAGATTVNYDPTATGRYTVKVMSSGCTAGVVSTDTINVTVKPAPTAAINPSPSVTICTGEIATLTGSGSGDYQWYNSTGVIAGATSGNYATSTPNDYTLVVTNTTNGCSDTSDITKVISTPAPTVSIFPADSVSVCTGLSTTLRSVSTGFGLSYQWINGAGVMPGKTADTLGTAAAGNYMLIVTAGSCKDTSNNIKVKLLPLPNAIITSVGTTKVVCPMNSDMVLEATLATGYTYQWLLSGAAITGATAQKYSVATPGTYAVKVTDAFGCIKISDTFTAVFTPSSNPTVSPLDLAFCDGKSLTLYSNIDKYYVGFQWYKDGMLTPGETSPTSNIVASGAYAVEITDSFNCKTMSAASVANVYDLPVKPLITQTGTQLSTKPYVTYQWYRNGKAISGADKRTYDVIFDGIYNVEVTNVNGCFNMSDDYLFQKLGIQSTVAEAGRAYLYPNPSRDKIHIEYSKSFRLSVNDVQGKLILSDKDTPEIDMSGWADGLYFFTLRDNDGKLIQIEKVMKQSN